MKAPKPHRVLFVCLGNICRSPAAEEVFLSVLRSHGEDLAEWEIDSAGIGAWHVGELPDKRMRVHAGRRGITFSHRARQVSALDFDRFDLIIGMDSGNLSDLHEIAPTTEAARKIHPMMEFALTPTVYDHVPDPYYDGAEGFENVLNLLEDACEGLYQTISGGNH